MGDDKKTAVKKDRDASAFVRGVHAVQEHSLVAGGLPSDDVYRVLGDQRTTFSIQSSDGKKPSHALMRDRE